MGIVRLRSCCRPTHRHGLRAICVAPSSTRSSTFAVTIGSFTCWRGSCALSTGFIRSSGWRGVAFVSTRSAHATTACFETGRRDCVCGAVAAAGAPPATRASAVGLFMASRTDLATRIAAVIDPSPASRSTRTTVDGSRPRPASCWCCWRSRRCRPCARLRRSPRQPLRSVRWRGRKCEAVSGADRRHRVVSGTDRPDRPLRLRGALPAGTYRLAAPMDFVPATTIAL